MTIQHSAIVDPEIHEPKGISTAIAGQIYVADGAGSGAWTTSAASSTVLSLDVEDATDAVATYYIVSPVAGDLTAVYISIDSAFTVSNITVNVEIEGTPTSPDLLTLLFSGSAGGDNYVINPVSSNTVAAGDVISFIFAGGTGPVRAHIAAVITL